jgi:hypothetical protein
MPDFETHVCSSRVVGNDLKVLGNIASDCAGFDFAIMYFSSCAESWSMNSTSSFSSVYHAPPVSSTLGSNSES